MANEKSNALYQSLLKRGGQVVSLEELAAETEYAVSTLRTYVTKNYLCPWLFKDDEGQVRVGDVHDMAPSDIHRAVSQKRNRYAYEHLRVSELVSSLLERSKTNAGLALELINRPQLTNRLDAFVLLFMTAWEQLLKADMEMRDPGSIFNGQRSASGSGRPMTHGLQVALTTVMPDRKSPVRRNIEVLKDLRDGAAHLLVPEVTGIVTRYFQSALLNYIDHFAALAGEPPFRFEGTGLLTLGMRYHRPSLEALQVRHGELQARDVLALIESLEQEAQESKDPQFAVTIEHTLVLEKKESVGAIRLAKSPQGQLAVPVAVPKDPQKTCPHSTTDCVALLNERTDATWNTNAVARVAAFLKVKEGNNQYHFEFRGIHSYSDRFIEKVVERYRQDPSLIEKAWDWYRNGR